MSNMISQECSVTTDLLYWIVSLPLKKIVIQKMCMTVDELPRVQGIEAAAGLNIEGREDYLGI